MTESAEKDVRRLGQLKGERLPHEPVWRNVFEYMAPERAHGFNGNVVSGTDIQAQKARVLDGTATHSARLFSSGMASGLHPSNSLWFGMDAGGENEEENQFFDNAARIIFENIHAANFDAVAAECHADLGPAGWFVLYTDEKEGGGYHFEQWPLAQCFIACSKPGDLVDTIFREFELTLEQAVNEYGLTNLSSALQDKYKLGGEALGEKIWFVWAIYPRSIYVEGGAKLAKNKAFASCHHEVATKKMVRESGYDEFPCAVGRWRLVPGTPYAMGPGSDALPDIKTLNQIIELELANMDIAVSGMWKATNDGVYNSKTTRLGARKVVMVANMDNFQPLKTGADFNVAFSKADQLRASIRQTLLADILQPQDGPQMTATEVHARQQLIRQQLAPIFARLQSEFLQPLIVRCFFIALRAGILGKVPDSLRGRNFTVKYTSPMARSQRLEEVTAIDNVIAGMVQAIALDPAGAQDVLDLIIMPDAQRKRAEALGVAASLMRSPDQIKARRDARTQAADAAQAQAQNAQMAGMASEQMIKSALPAAA
ncbi:MAG: portal protein [Burkholderiaceae bacterium]|nr:portal protein [Burkholderiaceae bacterium]